MGWTGTAGRAGQDAGNAGRLAGLGQAHHPAAFIDADERPTLLLAGPAARTTQLADWARRAGLRCIGQIEMDALANRLALTVAVDMILVDARGHVVTATDARILAARHELEGTRLTVLTDLDGIDAAMALLDGPGTDFLCEPEPADLVSLFVTTALAVERRKQGPCFHDNARNDNDSRIEQLSEEVRRLATTIERLAQQNHAVATEALIEQRPSYRGMAAGPTDGESERPDGKADAGRDKARLTSGEIRSVLRARRQREHFLSADLFADPAWDMILDLMAARLSSQRVSVSSLCIAAAVPPTTALRWIRQLTERGVFARIDDPADGRRVFIELTDTAAEGLTAWALTVRRNGGLLTPAAAD